MKALDVLQPNPTWEVNDPSKLTDYMRCQRKYFYTHVLGWKSEYPNNDLIFGSAWHLSAEHLLREGYTSESLYEASKLFVEYYRRYFDQSTDGIFAPKNPATALEALSKYAVNFQSDTREYQTLWTEIGGVVSISSSQTLYFKIDAILRDKTTGKIRFMDHKTSKRKHTDWGEHWILSTQMSTYTHVLNCLYPNEQIEGGKIRCSFFYMPKSEHYPAEFDEALIRKTPRQMNAWLTQVNHWMTSLYNDKVWLIEEDSPDKSTMESFPMNDTACFNFGRKCEFFDLCDSWSNPLQHCDFPPIGLKVDFWDPTDNEVIREKVDLT